MKKAILMISMLVASIFCCNIMAQITGGTINGAILPKNECLAPLKGGTISITGNNHKNYTLVSRQDKFSSYTIDFNKTGGKAKTTFTIFIDGVQNNEWTFEGTIKTGERTITLNNMLGKEVILKVKNHSATNKIEAKYKVKVNTNNMLSYGGNARLSDETVTTKITEPLSFRLIQPCNGKGTIEITRLGGNSSAEIVVTQGNIVLKTVSMASGDTSKRINLNNVPESNGSVLELTIRNIETNKFIRAKIGVWFN